MLKSLAAWSARCHVSVLSALAGPEAESCPTGLGAGHFPGRRPSECREAGPGQPVLSGQVFWHLGGPGDAVPKVNSGRCAPRQSRLGGWRTREQTS